MKCIYCSSDKLYILSDSRYKCALCKKKFSPKKVMQKRDIINCFCLNLSVNRAKEDLGLNYATVKKTYDDIRNKIAIYLQEQYNQEQVVSYEEYLYLEKSKRRFKENIFDSKNFITFTYEDKVFTLLMPTIARYKEQFLADGLEDVYLKEFSRFMTFNKIIKTTKKRNIIEEFWLFFENEILKYKGINEDNYFHYLKEIEFKFNYSLKEQIEILMSQVKI